MDAPRSARTLEIFEEAGLQAEMSGRSLPMVARTGFGGHTDILCEETSGVSDRKIAPIVGRAFAKHLEQ